jgi:hypothetical protein
MQREEADVGTLRKNAPKLDGGCCLALEENRAERKFMEGKIVGKSFYTPLTWRRKRC